MIFFLKSQVFSDTITQAYVSTIGLYNAFYVLTLAHHDFQHLSM